MILDMTMIIRFAAFLVWKVVDMIVDLVFFPLLFLLCIQASSGERERVNKGGLHCTINSLNCVSAV